MRALTAFLLAAHLAATLQAANWPPKKFTLRHTQDPAVVLRTFSVKVKCMAGDQLQHVEVSGSIPLLLPAKKFETMNDALRRLVFERIDIGCTGPPEPSLTPERGEISDDCEVVFRTSEFVTISCQVAWSGSAMGMHPDGNIERATYRVDTAKPLEAADLVQSANTGALEQRIREEIVRDNAEELSGAPDEAISEIVGSMLASPVLAKEGLSFKYSSRWHFFEVTIPYGEAEAFLQPSVLRNLAKKGGP